MMHSPRFPPLLLTLKNFFLTLGLVAIFVSAAPQSVRAAQIFYSDLAAFNGASSSAIVETFEEFNPNDRQIVAAVVGRRNGDTDPTHGGSDFFFAGVDTGVKGMSLWGNPYTVGVAGGDDVDGPGTHVAMMDAWLGLMASQADVNRVNSKALGAAFGTRMCALCLFFADSPITGGDLIGLDMGFGYQAPENKQIGNAWALLRLDLGLQVAARPLNDLEVVLRYFVISHWNSVRDVGSSDDIYVLEPGIRYRQWLVDVGFAAKPFAYPLLAEHGATGSLLALRARYLFDMKKGYFAGLAYENIGAPSTASSAYKSNVFRLMFGQQL